MTAPTPVPIVQQSYPADSYAAYPANKPRPIRGVGLHHTATTLLASPHRGGSWHYQIDRDNVATIYKAIPVEHAAHHIGQTDKWRPAWVTPDPTHQVSDINYCSIGIEIVCAPQAPYNQGITAAQHNALSYLLSLIYAKYGSLPIIGHGEVDSSRWPTEPHSLSYSLADIGPSVDSLGRFYTPDAVVSDPSDPNNEYGDNVNPISDEDLKAYLESYGVPVNMDTAIIKRAALAYRRGETRGPAISPEYQYGDFVRQRFTAATCEYDPSTGGIGWVEVNIHQES